MKRRDPASDAFADFLERRERGEPVEPEAFVKEHPALKDALERRFRTLDQVERTLRRAEPGRGSKAGAGEASRLSGQRIGPCRLLARIGLGSMGAVYRAHVEEDADGLLRGQVVAVKVFHPALLGREQLVARFRREGQIGLTFRHVNLVRAFALGATPVGGRTVPYLVMEHVEGEDLQRRLAREKRLPERFCRRLARAVARGLAALGAQGVVHRDLKPQNVMLGADGSIQVLDFGLARLVDPAARLTQSGTFVGSVLYAAPEQFEGTAATLDARADLYALGLLLYEAATGVLPWPTEGVGDALRRRLRGPAPSPQARRPDLSDFFDAVVTTLLQPDRNARFADAEALLAVLEEEESSAWWQARHPSATAAEEAGPAAGRAPAAEPSAPTEQALAPLAAACLGSWVLRAKAGKSAVGTSVFVAGPEPAVLLEDTRLRPEGAAGEGWSVHGVWTFHPARRAASAWWFEAGGGDPTYLVGTLTADRADLRGRAPDGARRVDMSCAEGRLLLRIEREGRAPLVLVGERPPPASGTQK